MIRDSNKLKIRKYLKRLIGDKYINGKPIHFQYDWKRSMRSMNKELKKFSERLAEVVEAGGKYTVTVRARRRLPATGIALDAEVYGGPLLQSGEYAHG